MFLTDKLFPKEALKTNVVFTPSIIDFDEIEEPRTIMDSNADDMDDDDDDDDWDDDDDDD